MYTHTHFHTQTYESMCTYICTLSFMHLQACLHTHTYISVDGYRYWLADVIEGVDGDADMWIH